MRRTDRRRLSDVLEALDVIDAHLERGGLHDGLVYDAVRIRLLEIGEAVKAVSADLLAEEAEVPWRAIGRMRDHLAHRYFDTDHAVVVDVVARELDPLREAVVRLLARLDAAEGG